MALFKSWYGSLRLRLSHITCFSTTVPTLPVAPSAALDAGANRPPSAASYHTDERFSRCQSTVSWTDIPSPVDIPHGPISQGGKVVVSPNDASVAVYELPPVSTPQSMAEEPGSIDEVERAQAMSSLLELRRQLTQRRHELSTLGAKHRTALQSYQNKRRFTHESIVAMVDDFALHTESSLAQTPVTSFATLTVQLREDKAALEDQLDVAIGAEAKVAFATLRVAESEGRMLAALDDLANKLLGGEALVRRQDQESPPCASLTSQEADEMPELARKYFDKLGGISLADEDLVDLHSHYAENRMQRELLRDQEREPSIPDEEFERRYTTARGALLEQMCDDRKEAAQLSEQCAKQGLDLERLQFRHPPHQAETGLDANFYASHFDFIETLPITTEWTIRGSPNGNIMVPTAPVHIELPSPDPVEAWLSQASGGDSTGDDLQGPY